MALARPFLHRGASLAIFCGVVKLAISIARERNEDAVGKRRVNEAARQYAEDAKLPEIKRDTGDESDTHELLLYDIIRFVRDTKKKNCFHINLDELGREPALHTLVDSLVDVRLLHLISDNTTNARRAGRFAAYLLDLGLYGHPERRGENSVEEVPFWERDSAGRLKHLERSSVYPLRTLASIRESMEAIRSAGVRIPELILPHEESVTPNDSVATVRQNVQRLFPELEEDQSNA